jgi:hypothetical protein
VPTVHRLAANTNKVEPVCGKAACHDAWKQREQRSFDVKRTDWDRATEVADYVLMGPGYQDIRDRVHRLLAEARSEKRGQPDAQLEQEKRDNTVESLGVLQEALGPLLKKEEGMISVELDEEGNPKSAIPIDAHASAHINTFWNELIKAVSEKEPQSGVSVLLKKNIFLMAEKAYRMGIARDHFEHRKMKESYDKMAILLGKLLVELVEIRCAKTLEKALEHAEKAFAFGPMTPEELCDQRASFAYGQLVMQKRFHNASPEDLAELRQMCRKIAGCKDA